MGMRDELDLPRGLAALNNGVQRLGRWPALVIFCLVLVLVSVGLSQLVISLLGRGDRAIASLCAGVCALVLGAGFGHAFLALLDFSGRSFNQLRRNATLDPHTGVFNRRYFLSLAERECSLARRHRTDCALVLLKVDSMRKVIDLFGQTCAEILMRQIAEASEEILRQGDMLARQSFDEFILLLPHTDPLGAVDVANRIRERVERLDFAWNSHHMPVSASLGVGTLQPSHLTLAQLIGDTQIALDMALSAGRNCVRTRLPTI
ncbi:GGDEF domain-containing protein [Roseateles koreensis]|uniref:diguanylate cyclase n=1 Tax=Roseateles koreensis TaxID=2987526 RepID=A0ABT5KQU8_9BURK|nr:GGDEF domain-containing protein [Roseateles koreensis]MDC8785278.1 GGDEF domain-containing protein [Roseateles koreensis]